MPYDLFYGQFEYKKRTIWRDVFMLGIGALLVKLTGTKR